MSDFLTINCGFDDYLEKKIHFIFILEGSRTISAKFHFWTWRCISMVWYARTDKINTQTTASGLENHYILVNKSKTDQDI